MNLLVTLDFDYGDYANTCIQSRLERLIREAIADTIPSFLTPRIDDRDPTTWKVELRVTPTPPPEARYNALISLQDALESLWDIEDRYNTPEVQEEAARDEQGSRLIEAYEQNRYE